MPPGDEWAELDGFTPDEVARALGRVGQLAETLRKCESMCLDMDEPIALMAAEMAARDAGIVERLLTQLPGLLTEDDQRIRDAYEKGAAHWRKVVERLTDEVESEHDGGREALGEEIVACIHDPDDDHQLHESKADVALRCVHELDARHSSMCEHAAELEVEAARARDTAYRECAQIASDYVHAPEMLGPFAVSTGIHNAIERARLGDLAGSAGVPHSVGVAPGQPTAPSSPAPTFEDGLRDAADAREDARQVQRTAWQGRDLALQALEPLIDAATPP